MVKAVNQNGNFLPDCAGVIYPYAANKKWNEVFRLDARLDAAVNDVILRLAVKAMWPHFPQFFARLSVSGRSYMEIPVSYTDIVIPDTGEICAPFDLSDETRPLLRLMYGGDVLILEISHVLSDGHGTLEFFKALLAQYYIALGRPMKFDGIIDASMPPLPGEAEDAYRSVPAVDGKKSSLLESFALQYAPQCRKGALGLTDVSVSSDTLHSLSKQSGATIGAYVTAAFLKALADTYKTPALRKIKLSVPVDLRKYFPTDTLRNFALFFHVGLRPGKKTKNFSDVLSFVNEQFRDKLDSSVFSDMARGNVKMLNSALFRKAPLPLKKFALSFAFNWLGERFITANISNLGVVRLPTELESHVTDLCFVIGKARVVRINATVFSYRGRTKIVITSDVADDSAQRNFVNLLTSLGLDAVVGQSYIGGEAPGAGPGVTGGKMCG